MERTVDQRVDSLLNQLNLYNKTDYEKVRGIYDYICNNVVYDYENLEDDTYQLKYTAYAALVNGTAVCQGYALLFYRLALEAGLDARYVTGTANGDNHGWNIVEPEDDGVWRTTTS
jgi:transglutaminase/protease-like cytokinesis protein 3